ncbi:hypothetical protein NCER_100189 [Vairimorpha ceranae BRL01]|uniref:Uncharacterized protein n=2 Tax=Vairimorpha ceranae TaxID=40302 RepID=C4V6Y7_VAIC1|nr:ubiquitin fusion-degradation protein [Vairimorpha ceranae]EEQ83019.1 hypothetical protein NCER_100189 [Vairimorpha ceranae BRL01]KAF5141231.1 hypothetical protein G9O61_00g005480 [Vairimorpha ceranae]KKO76083.1 ubiquitin fusion-degradation protein [Vairimorpha ceranae]
MEQEYKSYRKLENDKNYELIYNALNLQIKNIKNSCINIKDVVSIKKYIDDEIRARMFNKKGIPTFIIKIIILLGDNYEQEMKIKIINLLVSEYVTEFQLFIINEFKNLSDIKKYYKKVNDILEEIQNVYFNLPQEWNTKIVILSDIYIIIKQKICDIIFFNDFKDTEYLGSVECIIDNEKNMIELFKDSKKSIFHLIVPFINPFYKQLLDKTPESEFDLKNSEMKIYKNFVIFFQEFQKIYEKIACFQNIDAIKQLIDVFEEHILRLMRSMGRIYLCCDYELEACKNFNINDLEKIMTSLNTLLYLNECITDLNTSIYCSYNINITQNIFIKLGNLENKYNSILEIYVRNVLEKIDFTKLSISADIILNLDTYIFYFNYEDFYEELKINLVEVITLQILCRIYLLDFNEESAELMICDLYELKKYLKSHCSNVSCFNILESYLKIFMCSPKDMQSFIENFKILSNNVFSFKQIVWSLKDKESVLDLLEAFDSYKTFNL